jgi:hypothetical protein
MKLVTPFDNATGLFAAPVFASEAYLVRLESTGVAMVAGRFDKRTQRVDVVALAAAGPSAAPQDFVVPYQQPLQIRAAIDREVRRIDALGAIDTMERQQARVIRESVVALLALLPNGPEKAQLQARVQQIDDQIAARRQELTP